MKQKLKYILIGIILTLVCIYIGTLVKIEILTHNHYDEFKNEYKQNTMLPGNIEFFKVMEYKQYELAKVYYVFEDYCLGTVLTFAYDDGWKAVAWGDTWSNSGTAETIVYPYFWHWVYFMFER